MESVTNATPSGISGRPPRLSGMNDKNNLHLLPEISYNGMQDDPGVPFALQSRGHLYVERGVMAYVRSSALSSGGHRYRARLRGGKLPLKESPSLYL